MATANRTVGGLEILAPAAPGDGAVLSPAALELVADLARRFGGRVEEALARRRERQARFDAGERPRFLPETAAVREGAWTVAPLPPDLLDRRVEITGPVDRKMVINALNSGASVFMADFEDSNAPTWENVVEGQRNLSDAVGGSIRYVQPGSGKVYALGPKVATLMVRPRGWHLPEKHVRLDGRSVPASLFDFGLYFFHNARKLLARGTGPYFYLPKMQSHLEARLWNDVFVRAQEALGIPRGTIKTLRRDPAFVMPDRGQVTMEQPFLRAYTQLLVKTCHRRGAHAMGGMAAQIPIKDDPDASRAALDKVRADKLREVKDGHDGTWVAHPGLVAVAREVFDAHMPTPNQLHVKRDDVRVTAEDLLRVPQGTRTEAGLRHNIRVGVQYLESWLRGAGCVPLYDLMEDAATAEISRTQVWQWIHHRATLDDGRPLTVERFRTALGQEMDGLARALGPGRFGTGRFGEAADLFDRMSTSEVFEEFLTLPAYDSLP